MPAHHSLFGGSPGELVPPVGMGDLKALWNIYKDIESQYPGELVAVAGSFTQQACSAGADVGAVGYRCAMLRLLERLPGDLLTPWKEGGQLKDAVFSVAARIPMSWIGVGIPQSRLPFDLGSFFDQLR